MTSEEKNQVLRSMIRLLGVHEKEFLTANQADVTAYTGEDQAMYDRLVMDEKKVAGMIAAVQTVLDKPEPVGKEHYRFEHPEGMTVVNRTAPFGTILIIYESRPDVTIEAAVIAFKTGNRILLKGGKESKQSNLFLVELWHKALKEHGLSTSWITYLNYSREETQNYLKSPNMPADLIVPRGGEKLIEFVKAHARVPVLVSGRGNNFVYVDQEADWQKVIPIILNAKTQKISACNALDKVLIHSGLPQLEDRIRELIHALQAEQVEVIIDLGIRDRVRPLNLPVVSDDAIWYQEFLSKKIVLGLVVRIDRAIQWVNQFSGGHSVSIITENSDIAQQFMEEVDAAAVYHNASTRFTDGGEFGLGAELAISTDKLHHRGPLGLEHLLSNKWYIYGDGQIRN